MAVGSSPGNNTTVNDTPKKLAAAKASPAVARSQATTGAATEPADAQQQNQTFTQQSAPTGTTGMTPTQSIRKMLITAGYGVSATGPMTPRLKAAYQHYSATKGAGAKVWNIHNPQQITTPTAPPVNPADAVTAPGLGTGNPTTAPPGGAVPGTLSFSKQLLAQLSKEFAPYSGTNGVAPVINANQVGAAQADLQYGGAVRQQQSDINEMQGAEPIAQQNISKYFAPVQAGASSAVDSIDAADAANVAATAKLSPELSAALGLSGGAAGAINTAGDNATDSASTIGTIQHQDALDSQAAAQRAEQQAHTTEDSNSTIGLEAARQNLINQIANKGSAQVADTATAKQQNFANEGQAITNAGNISNINATNAVAASTVEGAALDDQAKQQGLATGQQANTRANVTLTDNLKNSALSRALQQQTQKLNVATNVVNLKRTLQTPIPGTNKSTIVPFGQIDAGTRQTMASTMWTSVAGLSPAKAEQALNGYMSGVWNYQSTPLTRSFVKSVVASHHYDKTTGKYTS